MPFQISSNTVLRYCTAKFEEKNTFKVLFKWEFSSNQSTDNISLKCIPWQSFARLDYFNALSCLVVAGNMTEGTFCLC